MINRTSSKAYTQMKSNEVPEFTIPRSTDSQLSSSILSADHRTRIREAAQLTPSHDFLQVPKVNATLFREMGSQAPRNEQPDRQVPLVTRVISKMSLLPHSLKEIVESYLERYKNDNDGLSRVWLSAFVNVPTTAIVSNDITAESARTLIDAKIHGQEKAKDALIRELMFWKITKNHRFKIALQGPPGVGKTVLLKNIGEIFGRPVISLNMDSIGDEMALVGNAPSYQGNNLGLFLNAFIQGGCSNPIIFIDELDKVKQNISGRRILDLLNQWLDDERPYFDSVYLGMRIDLSKCAFVIAANDLASIENYASLYDRLQPVIKVHGYDFKKQISIFNEMIVPELSQKLPGARTVLFQPGSVEKLVEAYRIEYGNKDCGVRGLKIWAEYILKISMGHEKSIIDQEDIMEGLEDLSRSK